MNHYTGAPLFFFLSAFEVKVIQNITPKDAFTSTADKLFQTTGAYKYDLVHRKQCLAQQTYLKPPVHVQEYFCRKRTYFSGHLQTFFGSTLANVYQSLQKKNT